MCKKPISIVLVAAFFTLTFCVTGCGKKSSNVTEEDVKALDFGMTLDAVVAKLGQPSQRGRKVTTSSEHMPDGGSITKLYPQELEACVWQNDVTAYVLTFGSEGLVEIESYLIAYTKVTVE